MSLAINKLIVAIMVAVFILVVGITLFLYTDDPLETLMSAFEEVTTNDRLTREEKNTYAIEAYNKLASNIEENCNEKETDDCFCFSKSRGTISEASYIHVKNGGGNSEFSLVNDEQVYLQQPETRDFSVGLFTLRNTGGDKWSLDCTYPTEFFIVGKDISETPYVNGWAVVWKGQGLSEDGYQFYGDSYYESTWSGKGGKVSIGTIDNLEAVPYIYKIDETHICLLTTLIEVNDKDYSGEVSSSNLASVGSQGLIFKDPKVSDIQEFFKIDDSTRYCSKEYT
jgi:hypothetical protein